MGDDKYQQAKFRPVPDADGVHATLMRVEYLARRRIVRRKMMPQPPRFLYKFRSLQRAPDPKPGARIFTAESLDRLRTVLVDAHLRLSSPLEFNDPFDMGARWVIEGSTQERLSRFNALVEDQMPGLTFQKRAEAVERLMTASSSTLLPLLEQSFRRQRSEFGVYCFAGDPRSVLMWSHYSDNHTGIYLQFERTRDLVVLSRAVSIDYIDEYPKVNWIEGMHNALGDTFTRKHSRWSYEDERRIFADGQAGLYVPIQPDALTGLIFGCRSDGNVQAAVADILAERVGAGLPPVRLYYARQNPNRYDLDIWSKPETHRLPPERPLLADPG